MRMSLCMSTWVTLRWARRWIDWRDGWLFSKPVLFSYLPRREALKLWGHPTKVRLFPSRTELETLAGKARVWSGTQWGTGEQTRISGKTLSCCISVVSVNQRKWDNCHWLIRGRAAGGEMMYVLSALGLLQQSWCQGGIPFLVSKKRRKRWRRRRKKHWTRRKHRGRLWKEEIHTQEKVKVKHNNPDCSGLTHWRKHGTLPQAVAPVVTILLLPPTLESSPALTHLELAAGSLP